MKLWDIVKNVGSAALQTALPGTGSLIVGAVNQFLDDDKKLPETATGQDVSGAINALPPEQQSQILNKEFDVKIEQIQQSYSTIRTMLDNESKSQHTTRPYIAKGSFHIVAFVIVVITSIWAYSVIMSDNPLGTIMDGWPFILALMAPLVGLLNAYFGILKKESSDRMNAANNMPSGVSFLSQIFKR